MMSSNYGTSSPRAAYAPASNVCSLPYQGLRSAGPSQGPTPFAQHRAAPMWALPGDWVVPAVATYCMGRAAYLIYRDSRRLIQGGWAGFAGPQGAIGAANAGVPGVPAGPVAAAAPVVADQPPQRDPPQLRAIACQAAAHAAHGVAPREVARSLTQLPHHLQNEVLTAHEPARAAYKEAHPYQWRLDYLAGLLRRS
ncbi:MAG: hypothetical protein JWQ16_384 [Novosphingobium sp.]|nr:hypothetical protein [Novosphingobium sp.]